MKTERTILLWQRFLAQGDDETFAPLFEAEKNLVWTICARFLKATEDIEEAFQSAWMRVLVEARAGRGLRTSPTSTSAEPPDARPTPCANAGRATAFGTFPCSLPTKPSLHPRRPIPH